MGEWATFHLSEASLALWLISLLDRKRGRKERPTPELKLGKKEGREGSKVGGKEGPWKIWTPDVRFCLDKEREANWQACHKGIRGREDTLMTNRRT